MNLRKCNQLWFEPVENLTPEDLSLLHHAFSVGYTPLGDQFSDSNDEWINWKLDVLAKIINHK